MEEVEAIYLEEAAKIGAIDLGAEMISVIRLDSARIEEAGLEVSSAYQNFRLQIGSKGGTISKQHLTRCFVPHHCRLCLGGR